MVCKKMLVLVGPAYPFCLGCFRELFTLMTMPCYKPHDWPSSESFASKTDNWSRPNVANLIGEIRTNMLRDNTDIINTKHQQ